MKVIKSKHGEGFVQSITTNGAGVPNGVILTELKDAKFFEGQGAEDYLQLVLTLLIDDVKENFEILEVSFTVVNPETY
jgi:hypothetical protein